MIDCRTPAPRAALLLRLAERLFDQLQHAFDGPLPRDGVILELKYDTQAPRWMVDLVKIFNLFQISVCKYTACIAAQQVQWHRKVLLEQEEDLISATWRD